MANFEFKLEGVGELVAKLQKAASNLPHEIASEVYQFGEEIMTDSKAVVPVHTGALMNTGHVEPPVMDGGRVSVTLGYGDESVGYALAVHENLNPVHWHRPGSGPKYLENPLHARQHELPDRVATRTRKVLLEG